MAGASQDDEILNIVRDPKNYMHVRAGGSTDFFANQANQIRDPNKRAMALSAVAGLEPIAAATRTEQQALMQDKAFMQTIEAQQLELAKQQEQFTREGKLAELQGLEAKFSYLETQTREKGAQMSMYAVSLEQQGSPAAAEYRLAASTASVAALNIRRSIEILKAQMDAMGGANPDGYVSVDTAFNRAWEGTIDSLIESGGWSRKTALNYLATGPDNDDAGVLKQLSGMYEMYERMSGGQGTPEDFLERYAKATLEAFNDYATLNRGWSLGPLGDVGNPNGLPQKSLFTDILPTALPPAAKAPKLNVEPTPTSPRKK